MPKRHILGGPFCSPLFPLSTENNAQHESCELSFIWGIMKIIALETAFLIALRNCSEEVVGEGQYICDFGEGRVHAIKHTFFAEGCY